MHILALELHVEEIVPVLMFLIAAIIFFDLRKEKISKVLYKPVLIVQVCILWVFALFFDVIDNLALTDWWYPAFNALQHIFQFLAAFLLFFIAYKKIKKESG